MKSLVFFVVFLANTQCRCIIDTNSDRHHFSIFLFKDVQCQCTGGYWPIQEPNIGSFTVSWQYNIALNTVQFIIQGETANTIDLTSTYLAIGWSDTTPTMVCIIQIQ